MKSRNSRAVFVGLWSALLLISFSDAHAQQRGEVSAGDLVISDAWMPQPLQGARAGAIYLKIRNNGNAPDQLLGAESPVAQRMMLHESKDSGGVMKMLSRSSVEIPPHDGVELKPMGIHLMATGLKSAPKKAATFPILLKFTRAGTVTVDVIVQSSDSLKPSSD